MNNQLSPITVGLALGCTFAIGIAFLAIVSMIAGEYGKTMISFISTVYLGYRATIPGAIIGAIWAFLDGFICGYLFSVIYNKFAKAA